MSLAVDPGQLGQALGAALVVAITCVAAIRQGLARWQRTQGANQLTEKRAMRAAVRAELSKHLASFLGRLDSLERGLEALQRRQLQATARSTTGRGAGPPSKAPQLAGKRTRR
jgi:hypothetical protein